MKPRWEVDRAALARAAQEIGLKWPIKVYRTYAATHYGRYQAYVCHSTQQFRHNISVDKMASPGFASEILWHELAHAYEAEQLARRKTTFKFIKTYDSSMKAQYDQHGVWDSPSECQARAWETRAKDFPLTRRAK